MQYEQRIKHYRQARNAQKAGNNILWATLWTMVAFIVIGTLVNITID